MDAIETFVRRLNDTWRAGDYAALRAFYASDVVLLPPDGSPPRIGVDAMIESYREFDEVGTVTAFSVDAVDVFEFGAFALCHLAFSIAYRIDGSAFAERGTDVYALRLAPGADPEIVWRTQLPGEEAPADAVTEAGA